ncbi:hypothetical protein BDW22DRAFT_1356945 [Trametopsis cervina]|nr:hypothetical protein BDW22DRAFT_1356945 [Trametopsis cervina]
MSSRLSANTSSRNAPPNTGSATDALSEELPPAYTAVPDFQHGETTVEYGPRRPFQQAPLPVIPPISNGPPRQFPPWQSAQPSGNAWHRPAASGWQSNWLTPPGQMHRSATTASRPPPPRHPSRSGPHDISPSFTGGSYRPPPGPPPAQHPRPAQPHPPTSPPSSNSLSAPPPVPPGSASDFARDFYLCGVDDTALMGGASDQYSAPAASLEVNRAARPVTPPQRPAAATSAPSSPSSSTSQDGRPTETPVPGHPLLHKGRVLVYPAGHECSKCLNTGYKHHDPSHPCTKCWQKYGKPFSGPIAYAPWGDNAAQSRGNLNLQRPLRALGLSPPVQQHRHSTSLTDISVPPGGGRATLSRSASAVQRPASSSYPGMGYAPPFDSSPYPGPSAQYVPTHGPPPPGAVVVRAGDSRLGGRMCWRCDGAGTVSLFFFDQSTCDVCNGMGRVFR